MLEVYRGPLIYNASMTANEFRRLYTEARKKAIRMDQATRNQLLKVYQQAAKEAAEVVARAIERGASELTVIRWQAIKRQLEANSAALLGQGVEKITYDLVKDTASLFADVNAKLILDCAKKAGATALINNIGMQRMVASVNERVVRSLVSRVWQDGHTFSDRVWGRAGVKEYWLDGIRNTISAGIAQGRDPVKIAKDIQAYTRDGKVALLNRWGTLERGTQEFAKRLPGRLDWRAVRLVRSELYASLQDSAVLAGEANPGTTGYYDWLLSPNRSHWTCECASNAEGGPYKLDDIPPYPHPNCMCIVRPRLMNLNTFVSDLSRWAKGESVDYLDSWYDTQYQAA